MRTLFWAALCFIANVSMACLATGRRLHDGPVAHCILGLPEDGPAPGQYVPGFQAVRPALRLLARALSAPRRPPGSSRSDQRDKRHHHGHRYCQPTRRRRHRQPTATAPPTTIAATVTPTAATAATAATTTATTAASRHHHHRHQLMSFAARTAFPQARAGSPWTRRSTWKKSPVQNRITARGRDRSPCWIRSGNPSENPSENAATSLDGKRRRGPRSDQERKADGDSGK